jgi:hypothetical protein
VGTDIPILRPPSGAMMQRWSRSVGMSRQRAPVYTVGVILMLWATQFVGGKVASAIGVSGPLGTVIVLYVAGVAGGLTVILRHRHRN